MWSTVLLFLKLTYYLNTQARPELNLKKVYERSKQHDLYEKQHGNHEEDDDASDEVWAHAESIKEFYDTVQKWVGGGSCLMY